jgi:exonuclease III
MQVYRPTTEHEDEAVEDVYEEIEKLTKHVKGDRNLIILGDWNAIVGEGRGEKITGNYGLGKRNQRGESLVDFFDKHKLVVENILFQNDERRIYSWMMQGDRGRYLIDYVLVKHRSRNQVKNCKTYPGTDKEIDHNKVLMKYNLKFKRMVKRSHKMECEEIKR